MSTAPSNIQSVGLLVEEERKPTIAPDEKLRVVILRDGSGGAVNASAQPRCR